MESRRQQQYQMPPPPWPGGSTGGGGAQAQGGKISNRGSGSGPSSAQSRFVEGSMNDRVSAAPPPDFLGPNELAAYERQFYYSPTLAQGAGGGSGGGGGGGQGRERASFQHYPPKSNREFYQRRPLSSSGSSSVHQQQIQPQQQPQSQPQLQTRRSKKFLAPLWDGVREKLNLSRAKSSNSIGGIFSKEDKGPALPVPVAPVENDGRASISVTPGDSTGYPTREEVLESYKNLVASGFFQAHATQGTRHPHPRHGGVNDAHSGAGSAASPRTSQGPPVALKSFSQHLASANAQGQKPPVPAFSPTQYNGIQESRTTDLRFGAPPPPQTRPPPPPITMRPASMPQQDGDIPSPQRGTKRGMPNDASDNDTSTTGGGARKLVKKLRRSASRVSMEFNLGSSNSQAMSKPRPSTSSAPAPSVCYGKDTPRTSVSSNRNVPPAIFTSTTTGLGIASANNPFYASPESFTSGPARPGMRTPPPKKKNKLTKLSSSTKEFSGRRIIGTLGFGGLRRTPSTSSKPPPAPPSQVEPPLPVQAPPTPPVSQPPITVSAPTPKTTASPPEVLLPPAIIDANDARKSFGDTDTEAEGDNYDSDAMVIDSPPPVVRQAAVARAVVAPAPSAFHYPQRQRAPRPQVSSTDESKTSHAGEPLRVLSPGVPNRGPPASDQYPNHHHHASGNTTPIKVIKRKPFSNNSSPSRSPLPATALSPPPARAHNRMSTTTIVGPELFSSPAKGNVDVKVINIRDSGLGHGYSHSFGSGSEFGCGAAAGGVDVHEDGDGDEDMENCPPHMSVPGVPVPAAVGGGGGGAQMGW